ncbi:MAG: SAM-dependent chlorinase/fluorinase [Candidatus Micrarchaeota archaeon]|nr:SAM-dependent chlorinase/fluorinase [Candidatus Micrarchaeota archaeon]
MIVTLTDFGNSEYSGILKGMVYLVCPKAIVSDLCNCVPRHSVREGAWMLLSAMRSFPKKTVFLAVVDPGVGGARQCLAIRTKNYFFVGPDNGLLYPAASADGIVEAVALPTRGASKTFHGRDVFAKAAGRIECGARLAGLGKKTVAGNRFVFHYDSARREGEVVRIDSFGNVITSVPPAGKNHYLLEAKGLKKTKISFHPAYGEAGENELFAIEGSAGTLELAVKEASAAKKTRLKAGDRLRLY